MTAYDDTVRGPVPTPQEYWDGLNGTAQQVLKVKRLHPDAIIPQYATDGAGCFDLHALDGGPVPPGSAATFRTGIAVEVPAGHTMLVYSRSGHGFKNDVRLANAVGVIDSDYRGEVMVRLTNDGFDPFDVGPGDRIAQAMLAPTPRVRFEEVSELSDTARGAGGFGSTGA